MDEGERGGVERLPRKEIRRLAVGRVAQHREVSRSEVDADLVRPSRLYPELEESGLLLKAFAHDEVSDRRTAVLDDRHLLPVARRAADRSLDRARFLSGRGEDDRQVALLDLPVVELGREEAVSGVVPGADD